MDISDITGAGEVLKTIVSSLEGLPCNIELLGPEGSGKTFVIEAVEQAVNNAEYSFIILRGDENKRSEDYYPLNAFIERKEKALKRGIVVIKEATTLIPYAGKLLKSFLDQVDLKNIMSKRDIGNTFPFQFHLDFSFHLIGLLNKYEKIVIICDDFGLYDIKTVEYLTSLQEGFLSLSKHFSISFLITAQESERVLSLLSSNKNHSFRLSTLDLSQVKMIVELWGMETPSDEQLQLIQSCSGGHLQLVKIICAYLKENRGIGEIEISQDFLKSIIDSRLKRLKGQQDAILSLLVAVFEAGKSSSMDELLCLLGENSDIQEVLKSAIQLNLLLRKDNQIYFAHSLIESYVESMRHSSKASFYEKLGKCVKKLTPSNYARRAVVGELSLNNDRCDILWTLDGIKKMREGREINEILNKKISSSELGRNLKIALGDFRACYHLALKGFLDETLETVEAISNALPIEIVAEKYFLKSETLAKKIARDPKEKALQIINTWQVIKEDEPEIWYRLMQVKVLLTAELGLIDIARETEAEIVMYFSSRITYDRESRDIIDRLNIFSEILYSPEIAHKKLLNVEIKLAKDIENERFHKLIDLYIARVNLSANNLILSEFDEAIKYAELAIKLISSYSEIKFPYSEVPLSNLYLSIAFKEPKELPTILKTYSSIYISTAIEENKILIDMNYAGLLVLDGQYQGALDVLDRCAYKPNPGIDDNFYSYYYWCNYAIVSYLSGKSSTSENLGKVKNIASEVSYTLSKYYVKHHELLTEILSEPESKNYQEILDSIENQLPVFSSKIWNRFKTAYLFTDIQIWTSS